MEPLKVRRGIDERWKWILRDPVTQALRNLAGATVTGMVRASYSPSDPILYEWKTSNGNVSANSIGEAYVSFPAVDSNAATWTDAYGEIRITHATGEIEQLFEGRVSISPSVMS